MLIQSYNSENMEGWTSTPYRFKLLLYVTHQPFNSGHAIAWHKTALGGPEFIEPPPSVLFSGGFCSTRIFPQMSIHVCSAYITTKKRREYMTRRDVYTESWILPVRCREKGDLVGSRIRLRISFEFCLLLSRSLFFLGWSDPIERGDHESVAVPKSYCLLLVEDSENISIWSMVPLIWTWCNGIRSKSEDIRPQPLIYSSLRDSWSRASRILRTEEGRIVIWQFSSLSLIARLYPPTKIDTLSSSPTCIRKPFDE